jgi:hypothetical protein
VNEGSLGKDLQLFVALGIFDIDDEGTENVWCLQLTLEEGLMLQKKDDVTFQRVGLFQLYKEDWFVDIEESEVRLV